MQKITYVTTNPDKLRELYLHTKMQFLHQSIDLPEIQSLDIEEVATEKVKSAYHIVKGPVIVEDQSLVFHALGKLPGPLIKWFWTELGLEALCRMLDPYSDKSATAITCFAFYDGKTLKTFIGERKGTIAREPRGNNSFAWSPIFIPENSTLTWGEMVKEGFKKTSMRKPAIKKLETFLQTYQKD